MLPAVTARSGPRSAAGAAPGPTTCSAAHSGTRRRGRSRHADRHAESRVFVMNGYGPKPASGRDAEGGGPGTPGPAGSGPPPGAVAARSSPSGGGDVRHVARRPAWPVAGDLGRADSAELRWAGLSLQAEQRSRRPRVPSPQANADPLLRPGSPRLRAAIGAGVKEVSPLLRARLRLGPRGTRAQAAGLRSPCLRLPLHGLWGTPPFPSAMVARSGERRERHTHSAGWGLQQGLEAEFASPATAQRKLSLSSRARRHTEPGP